MRFSIVFTLGVGVLVAGISGLSLLRAKSLMERELGVLTGRVDALDSDWDARSVPESGRSLTILLSDARAAFDPFFLPKRDEDGFTEKAGSWIGRNLVGGSPISSAPTALVRGFSDSTVLVSWTHDGFASFGEEAMAREVEKAVLKAHDAGAEINIVAQGRDAAVVLVALERLKGQVRGGHTVGANKVVLLGVSAGAKPDNVVELASVWSTREIGVTIQIRVFGGGMTGETMNLEEYWPGLSSGGDSIDKSVRLIQRSVENPKMLSELIRVQQAFVDEVRVKKSAEAEAKAVVQAKQDAARELAKAVAVQKAAKDGLHAANAGPNASLKPASTPSIPKRDHKTGSNAGATAVSRNWSTGQILNYSETMEGRPTGWLFSAPEEHLADLMKERMSVALKLDPSTGLRDEQCRVYMSIRARPERMIGSGDRESAIVALVKKDSNDERALLGSVSKQAVHKHPSMIFRTSEVYDGGRTSTAESSYFVVDAGPYVVYFNLHMTYHTATNMREPCMNAAMPLYQGIVESIRPE